MNTNPDNFFMSILSPFLDWLTNTISKPFKAFQTKFKETTSKVQEYMQGLFEKKEKSLKDYIRIGRYYVAKRLIVIISILLIAILYVIIFRPSAIITRFTNSFAVFSTSAKDLKRFTGKAKIYNKDKKLQYKGDLADGKYSGTGQVYYSNGKVSYDGSLAEGVPSGEGKSYNSDGSMLYSGSFKSGLYDGKGTLYTPDGAIKYDGDFKSNTYYGSGTLYYKAKVIEYQGAFVSGKYEGAGKLYSENGKLLYDGNFLGGVYSGDGTLYFPDESVKYKGSFSKNLYSGAGILNYPSGKNLYTGNFLNGKYDGAGKLFSSNGSLLYDGSFASGLYQGFGTLCSTSGAEVLKSFFDKGIPDYTKFLNMNYKDLSASIGDPLSETQNKNLTAEENYSKYGIAFTLSPASAPTSKGSVTAVRASGKFPVLGILPGQKLTDVRKKLGKPVYSLKINENSIPYYVLTYVKNKIQYDIYFSYSEKAVVFTEISALSGKPVSPDIKLLQKNTPVATP